MQFLNYLTSFLLIGAVSATAIPVAEPVANAIAEPFPEAFPEPIAFPEQSLDMPEVESSVTKTAVVMFTEKITKASFDLRVTVEGTTVLNVLIRAPSIIVSFRNIVRDIILIIPELAGNPFNAADAKDVVVVLTKFVEVHQQLLNVVIGKRGILASFGGGFLEPVRLVLVTLEAIVDSFAFSLIKLIPTESVAANGQFAKLKVTVRKTITVYSK
ncbi:hypothetical protein BZA77DRAFT_352948 [Pyronema omphalodes]|nr:hypothetical protein BZA77DRAFT_352948 [Pyronema omphalodes]